MEHCIRQCIIHKCLLFKVLAFINFRWGLFILFQIWNTWMSKDTRVQHYCLEQEFKLHHYQSVWKISHFHSDYSLVICSKQEKQLTRRKKHKIMTIKPPSPSNVLAKLAHLYLLPHTTTNVPLFSRTGMPCFRRNGSISWVNCSSGPSWSSTCHQSNDTHPFIMMHAEANLWIVRMENTQNVSLKLVESNMILYSFNNHTVSVARLPVRA